MMHVKTPIHILFKRINKSFLTLLLFIFCVAFCFSQQVLKFDRLNLDENTEKELSLYTTCFQDSKGFIWLGSFNGLLRYDGYQLKDFVNDPNDTLSIADNKINCITEDNNQNLWVGTQNGLNYFNRKTNRFKRILADGNGDQILGVANMISDIEGNLYCIYSTKFDFRLSTINNRDFEMQELLRSEDSLNVMSPESIWYLHAQGDSILWIATDSGLMSYHKTTGQFIQFNQKKKNDPKQSLLVNCIEKRDDQSLFLGTNEGIWIFDTKKKLFSKPFKEKPFNDWNILLLLKYRDGTIWFKPWIEDVGFYVYNPSTGQLSPHFTDRNNQRSLIDNGVTSFLSDNTGVVWITTLRGISTYNPRKNAIISFKTDPLSRIFFIADLQQPFEYTPGKIIYWKDNRLYLFNWQTGHDEEFPYRPVTNLDSWKTGIACYFRDDEGLLWMGTGGDGAFSFNENTKEFRHYFRGFGPIRDIISDKRGNIWFGFWQRGVVKMEKSSGKLTHYLPIEGDNSTLSSARVRVFYLDRRNDLWIGTRSGLSKYDPESDSFKRYVNEPGSPSSLSENTVFAMYEDVNNKLWLGTYGGGLNVLDINTDSIHYYTKEDGLADNNIVAIYPGDVNSLWLLTFLSLTHFNIKENTFKNYKYSDGLSNKEYSSFMHYQSPYTGHIFIEERNGLDIVHPDSLKSNAQSPNVSFTSFLLLNQPVTIQRGDNGSSSTFQLPFEIDECKELKFAHNENVISFEFASLDYNNPESNEYAYYLKGFDKEWQYIGTKRSVTFTNLDPGNYNLQIKGSNNDGVWSETKSLAITIFPPWWMTLWAKSFYGIAFFGGLFGFYQWRTSEQRKKLAQEQLLNARLRQIDQLKDQFLANTSHELRTPLHGIMGIAESLIDDLGRKSINDLKENLGLIMASGRRLTSLVNDLLDFSKAKNQDLQLQQKSLSLKSLSEIVLRSCHTLVGNNKVELKNNVTEEIPPVLADDNRMQQILFNLVGNSIKFTDRGYIAINATRKNGMVEVCVEDTGIGIPIEKQGVIFQSFEQADGSTAREYGGTGLGLSITKQLVELHGGEIWLESVPGTGSKFYFTIPVSDKPTSLATNRVISNVKLTDNSDFKLSIPVAGSAEDRIKILVVDDESINHQVLRNHLSDDHFLITSVMSGREAMEAIELGVKFDLVLLDVMMPRMTGYEVCEQMRKRYMSSELPIIMVTAKNQIQDLVKGLNLGANDYLAKPFSKDEFLARVKTQLDLHRIYDVTKRFVPNQFIRILGRERITEVRLGDHIEQEVTVFFSDIRNYTGLSEKMSPEENFNFINNYVGRIGPIIRNHEGFVNQYLGDGIMAIFPKTLDNALDAAIAMQNNIVEYNSERREKAQSLISVGMGIHSGPLIMGIIGDAERNEPTTISDTVNTASRMEGLTKRYGANIIVSNHSKKTLTDTSKFHFRYLGKVQVKGKNDPFEAYECVDGDVRDIRDLKFESMHLFEEGLEHFYSKDFAEASAAFGRILKTNPRDDVAHYFRDKAARYTYEGVPEDWDGVEKLDSK